ncbi:hypothetical protein B7Y92_02920 [Candidatus Saccharibacteria bacterium 32-50-13]|nr:MAG: hypothetical protein B7Y92_02920 [Candidatus Saccharibacteria bacterium 32-50-13]
MSHLPGTDTITSSLAKILRNTEIFSGDIPKTTVFRVDGKLLLVYRADYTAYDSDLLDG